MHTGPTECLGACQCSCEWISGCFGRLLLLICLRCAKSILFLALGLCVAWVRKWFKMFLRRLHIQLVPYNVQVTYRPPVINIVATNSLNYLLNINSPIFFTVEGIKARKMGYFGPSQAELKLWTTRMFKRYVPCLEACIKVWSNAYWHDPVLTCAQSKSVFNFLY